MADINDRLDRLHRREAFDRRGALPIRSAPEPGRGPATDRPGYPPAAHPAAPAAPPAPPAAPPAPPAPAASPAHQVRHRSGLPQRAPGQAASAHAPLAAPPQPPARPAPERPAPERPAAARPAPGAVPRPAGVDDRLGEVLDAVAEVVRRHHGLSVMVAIADGRPGRPVIRLTERDGGVVVGVVGAATDPAPARGLEPPAAARPEPAPQPAAAGPDRSATEPASATRRPGGRHAVQGGEEAPPPRPGPAPPTRSSWQYRLWSTDRSGAGRDRPPEHPPLRLVPDPEKAAEGAASAPSTSQVVSRLAQLLREDPSLAAGWGREAPEG